MSEKVCNLIGGGMKEAINLIYPVGRTIICDHSPQTDYPWQTWTQDFKDVFPLGAGDTYAAGATGGEAKHWLTVDEMPRHRHLPYIDGNTTSPTYRVFAGSDTWYNDNVGTASARVPSTDSGGYKGYEIRTNEVGGSQPHNNMPPYKAVKFWTRTA